MPDDLLHNKADLLVQNNRLPEAWALYGEICERDPDDADAWCMWGVLSIELGQPEAATEKLLKALALDAQNSMANYAIASLHANADRLHDALTHCQRAVDVDPEFAEAWLLLGDLQAGLERTAEAIKSLECVIAMDPAFTPAHRMLGNLWKNEGDLERAASHLNQALQDAPPEPADYDTLASIYLTLGRADDAEAVMRRAVALMPGQPMAHNSLGAILNAQGRHQEALGSFREAARLDPGYAAPIRNLATVSWLLGQPEQALEYTLKLLRLEPDVLLNRQNFMQALSNTTPDSASGEMLEQIERCFEMTGVDAQIIVNPVIRLLMNRREFLELKALIAEGAPARIDTAIADGRLDSVLSNRLFRLLLTHTLITDIELETLIAGLRGAILRLAASGGQPIAPADALTGFAVALACQFFTNEYICPQDGDEDRLLNVLSEQLEERVHDEARDPGDVEFRLTVLAMYTPLYGQRWLGPLIDRQPSCLSGDLQPILKRQWRDHFREAALKSTIAALTDIEDATSQAVREQYEESPYPRWLTVGLYSPRPHRDLLRELFATYAPPSDGPPGPVRALNAGCGTGRHAIMSATRYADCEVLAVDLSLSSLAYAKRSAEELRIDNVTFGQADILGLGTLDARFDLIECGGVLHHIPDTAAALKVLVDLLRPGGVIMVGLYSEIARDNVNKCAAFLHEQGFRKTTESVRRSRQAVIALDTSRPERRVVQSPDFYSLSACRDLLFHEHEHAYRLPDLAELLEGCGLRFLGFEALTPDVINRYREQYPEDPDCVDLGNWDRFEQNNPRTFAKMYNMWCQKSDG
jgi:tetratricopeptide (TPR) repeat protein/SAM-dependent methyltransferase